MNGMPRLVKRLLMPMDCRHVNRLMHGWLDGELSESQALLVAVHLADCDRCGVEVATYEAVKASLGRLRTQPDPGAVDRLRVFAERLAEEDPGHPTLLPDSSAS